jgi:hypothetical protein
MERFVMTHFGMAGAVRTGEHACSRLAHAEDRERLAIRYVCQYDHGQLGAGAQREIADVHEVDIAPELAAIGRDGYMAAARVGRGPKATLRLCGELDFGCADTLASILGAHYHGRLRLDLEDLEFVDVAGMRALRGRTAQPLTVGAGAVASPGACEQHRHCRVSASPGQ